MLYDLNTYIKYECYIKLLFGLLIQFTIRVTKSPEFILMLLINFVLSSLVSSGMGVNTLLRIVDCHVVFSAGSHCS